MNERSYGTSPRKRTNPVEQEIIMPTSEVNRLNDELFESAHNLSLWAMPDISTQVIRGVPVYERVSTESRQDSSPRRAKLTMSRGYDSRSDQFFYAINAGGVRLSTSPKPDDTGPGYWEINVKNKDDTQLINTDGVLSYIHAHLSRKDRQLFNDILDTAPLGSIESADEIFNRLSTIATSRIDIDHYRASDIMYHQLDEELTHHPRYVGSADPTPFYEATTDCELRIMKPHNQHVQFDLIIQSPVALEGATINKKYNYSLSVPNTIHIENGEKPTSAASVTLTSDNLSVGRLRSLTRVDYTDQEYSQLYRHGLDIITATHSTETLLH